jgi:hypothetical protein
MQHGIWLAGTKKAAIPVPLPACSPATTRLRRHHKYPSLSPPRLHRVNLFGPH